MKTAPAFIVNTFENIPQPTVLVNINADIVFCNNALLKVTGYNSPDLLGNSLDGLIEDSKTILFNEINKESAIEVWLNVIYKADTKVNCQIQITNVPYSNTNYYLLIINEAGNSSTLLDELNTLKELNTALSQATNEALFFSEKGVCIECNFKACEMFGYSYDEIIGIFGTDVIADESKEQVKNNMLTGYEKPYEALAVKKDGTKFWAEFQGKMFTYKGKQTRVTAVRDISHRKELESKHKFSENNYKLLFDNMNEAFALHKIIVDEHQKPIDYEYIDINPVFERLTGLKREIVIGKKLTEILPEIEPYWIEVFGKVALTGNPIEYTNYAKELKRHFDTRAYSPKPGYFAVAFTDATERIKIESEINFHNESLRSLVGLSQLRVNSYVEMISKVLQEGMNIVRGDCGAFYFYNADTGNYELESYYTDEYLAISDPYFKPVFKEVLLNKKPCIFSRNEIVKFANPKKCAINSMVCLPSKEKGVIPIVFVIGDADKEFTELEKKHLSMYFESSMHVIERQKYQDQVLNDKLKAEVYENRFAEIQKAGKIGWYEAILDKGLFQGSYETYMIFFDEHYDYPVGQEHLINAIHPDDREHFFNSVKDGVAKKLPEIEWEYRVVTPQKGIKHIFSKAFLNYNESGELIRRYGIVQDVTDKKLIEIEQKRNNERLESLFKMSQLTSLSVNELYDIVLNEILNLTGSLIGFVFQWNSKNQELELKTYSKGIITDQDLLKFKDFSSGNHSERILKLIAKGKPIVDNNALNNTGTVKKVLGDRLIISKTMLVPVKISDEEFLWVFVGNHKHDYGDSDVRQITLLMDSVWKLIKSQIYKNELIEAKNKAQESDKLKSAFLANMSHEIRTPMNGILGFSELIIEDEIPEEKRKEYAGIIMDSGKQLLSIVDDILDISKIEVGEVRIDKTNVYLKDVLNSLYAFFEPRATAINLNLSVEISNAELSITTDEQRLRQILTNLLSNAFKFTRKGEVRFGFNVVNNEIEFYVMDSGIGIPTHMQQTVFERFRQVEQTESFGHGGTGLGLSISQKLVELLGGRIWLESIEGNGATFYFTLPIDESNPI